MGGNFPGVPGNWRREQARKHENRMHVIFMSLNLCLGLMILHQSLVKDFAV